MIRTRTRCDEKLLADSRVKLIATATIGFDHIDTAWCAAHGIEVTTAAGCNARGVLQWVGAALVHLSRTQGWQPAERTLGIVGVGHVGSLVKAYAEGWYPPQAAPARRRPISWQELCRTIGGAYDIASESRSLKERPGDFESMRDHYAYRREYF